MNLLPIGSVVIINNGIRTLMITGRKQIDKTNGEIYDYLACLYPEGIVGEEYNFLFNKEDIKEVIFKGYESDEDIELQKKLEKLSVDYKKEFKR